MNILISGSIKEYAIENHYVKYLKEEGINTIHFGGHTIFQDFYEKSLFNKLAFKSRISSIYERINKQFKDLILDFNPDVICVFKGMEIYPETLSWVKQKGIYLVNYNPDNPYLFSGKGSGNKNILKSISLYDLYLTYDNDIKKILNTNYNVKSEILPFGFELSEESYNKLCLNEEINSVCFIGNPDKYRVDFLNQLASHDFQIDIYGHGWSKLIKNRNVNIFNAVYRESFWKNISRYRVQLNLMRIHNPNSHNMRSFEIPAAAGIMLAPDTPDHRSFYLPEKEVFLFQDLTSSIIQVKKILGMSVDEANKVRLAARNKAIHARYSYKNRAIQLLSYIQLNMNNR